MNIGEAFVTVRPDTRGFEGQVDSGIGGVFRKVAGVAAGAFAAVKIGGFLKGAIDEARESERVMRLTENAIRATGGAANVTADQVGDLATRLSNTTGIDDEVIQTASNLLLTFKNVKNEVGSGNAIFDRANQAVLDLSIQFGGVDGAAKQLGKALNDPIAGISALARAGVTFTDQQKEQIKVLVESGDVLGAQKIILGEVESQVGGAAAAAADPMQKLGVVLGNLKEQIGLALLPAISAAATFLGEHLPGAMAAAQGAFDALLPKVQQLAEWFSVNVLPVLQQFGDYLIGTVWPAVQQGVEALGGWTDVLIVAGIAIAAIISPIGVLVAAVIYAYTEFEGFRNVVDAVVVWFQTVAMPAIEAAGAGIAQSFADLVGWVQIHWAAIQEAIGHVIVAIQTVIETAIVAITLAWDAFGSEILALVEVAWGGIKNTVESVMGVIQGVIETIMALINGDWGEAWEGIRKIADEIWGLIKGQIETALGLIDVAIDTALSAIRLLWDTVWSGIADALRAAWDGMVSIVSSAIGDVVGFFAALPGRILAALGDIVGMMRAKGVEIIAGMLAGIVEKYLDLGAFLISIPGRITNAVGNLLDLLIEAGKDVIRGLIAGIEKMKDRLFDVVRGIGNFIKDQFERALEVGSPSKVMFEIGQNVIRGLIDGMVSFTPELTSTLEDITKITKEGLGSDRLFGEFARDTEVTFEEIVANLQQEAENITRFAAAFEQLQRRSLDTDLLEQLRTAGPDALPFAEALLGGSTTTINGLLAGIDRRNLNLQNVLVPGGRVGAELASQAQAAAADAAAAAAIEEAVAAAARAAYEATEAQHRAAEEAALAAIALAEFTRTTQEATALFGPFGERYGEVQRWAAAEAANAVEEFRQATQAAVEQYGPFGERFDRKSGAKLGGAPINHTTNVYLDGQLIAAHVETIIDGRQPSEALVRVGHG
jgi:phage-related protein